MHNYCLHSLSTDLSNASEACFTIGPGYTFADCFRNRGGGEELKCRPHLLNKTFQIIHTHSIADIIMLTAYFKLADDVALYCRPGKGLTYWYSSSSV